MSRDLFRASFTDSRLDQRKIQFIASKLIESKPRNFVGILKDFQRLIRLEVEKRHALIESAADLDEGTRTQLCETLKAKYGGDLTTEFKVTPELIGGLRVKIGSDVWDSSVRARLGRLQAEMARG